jgi:hypothetical protein
MLLARTSCSMNTDRLGYSYFLFPYKADRRQFARHDTLHIIPGPFRVAIHQNSRRHIPPDRNSVTQYSPSQPQTSRPPLTASQTQPARLQSDPLTVSSGVDNVKAAIMGRFQVHYTTTEWHRRQPVGACMLSNPDNSERVQGGDYTGCLNYANFWCRK